MSGDTEVAEVAVSNGSKMASETEHPKVNGGGIAAREEEKQEQEEEEENAAELSEQDKKILSQMQKIDTALQICSEEIRKMECMEVNMDDLESEDSAYIRDSQLKERFDNLYNVLVKLCKKNPHLVDPDVKLSKRVGGQFKKRITIRISRHDDINREVEVQLNKLKKFPDYQEVHHWIEEANRKEGLGLNQDMIRKEAESAFKEIGRILKRRRAMDDLLVNSSRLEVQMQASTSSATVADASTSPSAQTDASSGKSNQTLNGEQCVAKVSPVSFDAIIGSDPADNDEQLRNKLSENKREAVEKTTQIIEEYIKKEQNGEACEESDDASDTESASTTAKPAAGGEVGETTDGSAANSTNNADDDDDDDADDDDDSLSQNDNDEHSSSDEDDADCNDDDDENSVGAYLSEQKDERTPESLAAGNTNAVSTSGEPHVAICDVEKEAPEEVVSLSVLPLLKRSVEEAESKPESALSPAKKQCIDPAPAAPSQTASTSSSESTPTTKQASKPNTNTTTSNGAASAKSLNNSFDDCIIID